jgi:G3E family GTPase
MGFQTSWIVTAKRTDDRRQKAGSQAKKILYHTRREIMYRADTKLYVLTGFLGSGKTTVLLKLLEILKGHRIGIIQNEFGKLGIDGTILRNDEIQMVEINRGSIFCSCLKLNFVQALAEMAAQDFEYLFVESSGWGDPSNVQEILEAAKIVSGKEYDFRGVICFVDAVNFLEQVKEEETAFRQLKHCHLAVITKTDLVGEKQIEKVEEKIREINPVCEMKTSANGQIDDSFLKKDLLIYEWAECEETTNSVETKPKSIFMEYDGQIDRQKLNEFLTVIAPDVHRVKGFCNLTETGWTQVDVVGTLIDYKESEAFEKSQLVFISKIGPMIIKKILSAWQEHVGTEMKLRN